MDQMDFRAGRNRLQGPNLVFDNDSQTPIRLIIIRILDGVLV
jgi:hypothetical protein